MPRAMVAVVLCLSVALGSQAISQWQVVAQADVQIVIERPRADGVASTSLEITGYAYDPAATDGPGIDAVHIYMDGEPGERLARFLGEASYGLRRPDIAQQLGDSRFTNVGFSLLTEVPAGNHALFVYAHRSGAPPNEGWVRASVPRFEASLVAPRPTMVQPGPPAVGSEDGRYRTGNVSWQGGRTCVRYNGRGECEQSVPYSIVTGATCIQWNQRGQCTAYLPEPGLGSDTPGPAPTRAAPAQPELLRVPTVNPAGRQSGGGAPAAAPQRPAGVRAVAPPLESATAEGDAAPAPDTQPGQVRAVAPPPPAAPEPGGTTNAPAFSGASPGSGQRAPSAAPAAAPPSETPLEFPTPSSEVGGDPLPLPGAGAAPAAGAPAAQRGGHSMVAMDELGFDAFAPPESYVSTAENVAPLASPVPPHVMATQTALGSGAVGVGALRSGCALYLGCGDTPSQSATPTPTPTR
ncbi:MAG: hypothetical protein IRZ14_14045 [Chloroflexi bacterium]|nr:hypothetical protein [Chloroflexota bacterium]